LTMTQELIANMLGVRREGVTEAASKLHRAGVISYTRGQIPVLDRPKLEETKHPRNFRCAGATPVCVWPRVTSPRLEDC